jgi:bifunctional enzyme CysN/CysC
MAASGTQRFEDLLRERQRMDMLRFAMVGSVDDGKSTLIGRLLYDTRQICEDHVEAARKSTKQDLGGEIDFSLFTDGLRAEREQGITIDVAWRHFATPRRRFIVADSPGHEQYTRNMVTGASGVDLAVLLADAKRGLTTQSRRHAFIVSLLGTPHVVVAVNKMDLVGWSQAAFEDLRAEYEAFAQRLDVKDLVFIPVSGLQGDNVAATSQRMPWYQGSSLLHHLEHTWIGSDRNQVDLRFPVQYVVRPDATFRGYAGTVESGSLSVGDEVTVLPSGRRSRVQAIRTFDGEIPKAFTSDAVVVTLEHDVDVGRGDMIVHRRNIPSLMREADAILVWLSETPLAAQRTYLVRHTTNLVSAQVSEIAYRIDPDTLHRQDAKSLALNEIGRVGLRLFRPLVADDHSRNRRTGSFILVDPQSNATVAAGLLIERGRRETGFSPASARAPASIDITRVAGRVTADDRRRALGQRPVTVWLTGLSGAGKSTVAYAIEKRLVDQGRAVTVLDGDNVRHGLNRDLGFAPHERTENIRRVACVAGLMNDAGLIVLCSLISPFREDRDSARAIVGPERFVEIFVDAPLETCEARDPRGLYRKARDGQIPEFTGISSPYEPPENPELRLRTDEVTVDEAAAEVIRYLESRGVFAERRL